jgi:hypothetical protein
MGDRGKSYQKFHNSYSLLRIICNSYHTCGTRESVACIGFVKLFIEHFIPDI